MRVLTRAFWKTLDRLAVRASGYSHQSRLVGVPDLDATPVWVHGSARTGTTTIQRILARFLGRDFFFEPLHRTQGIAAADSSLEPFVRPFLSSPDVIGPDYLPDGGGSVACIESLASPSDRERTQHAFDSLMDHLYGTYGRKLVYKEIRFFGNLESLARYHEIRQIPWHFVGSPRRPCCRCTRTTVVVVCVSALPSRCRVHWSPGSTAGGRSIPWACSQGSPR